MEKKWREFSDEQLAVYVREKDKEAYEEVMVRYQDKLLRYAEYLIGESHLAADVVQEAFIKAFVNLNSFDGKKGKFSSWIYRIVHNEAMNALKREKKMLSFEKNEWLKEWFASSENVEEDFEKQEVKKMMLGCLSKLPVEYRSVLALYYLEDKKYEEISEVLKVPVGTVGIRLKRGKEKLKKICNNL